MARSSSTRRTSTATARSTTSASFTAPTRQMGGAGVAVPPAASLVIVRALTEGQRDLRPRPPPARLLPSAPRRVRLLAAPRRLDARAEAPRGPRAGRPDGLRRRARGRQGRRRARLDTLEVKLSSGNAVVRRVPLDAGAPQPKAARRLLSTLYARRGGALARLVERSSASRTSRTSSCGRRPTTSRRRTTTASRSTSSSCRGSASVRRARRRRRPPPLARAPRPLRRLAAQRGARRRAAEGAAALPAAAERARRGVRAAVGAREAVPPADLTDLLMTQFFVTRPRPRLGRLAPGVRHYLYPVHRSGAFLTPPLPAARLALLCRWLARDFESVFEFDVHCRRHEAVGGGGRSSGRCRRL